MKDRDYWDRDDIQFSRLLAEIKAVGLTPDQMNCLAVSMELSNEEIHELFDRAEETFEAIKEQLGTAEIACVNCGHRLDAEMGVKGSALDREL